MILGVGGAGSNVIAQMMGHGFTGADFACVNMDVESLRRNPAFLKIQLGTEEMGAGGDAEKGRQAALADAEKIRDALVDVQHLFIIAGMGGGTGTGAAPVIARIAKSMGISTMGVVTLPFGFEKAHRIQQAKQGLTALRASADEVIEVHNEQSQLELAGEITLDEAFSHVNDVLMRHIGHAMKHGVGTRYAGT